eukprot:CAMPEP_0177636872 /NCGR_PEP_ID=MMETSP0447-20121125/4668_1 /TAXON_ID=0 /ORGANISM="Stygamoeba regulata, Strain BSH-02190019" /LENGTH=189 /DNA_ID=CAMNT_0019138759 /DNA_START=169 /DNA_END=738 /DNA_ORIENTATION=+
MAKATVLVLGGANAGKQCFFHNLMGGAYQDENTLNLTTRSFEFNLGEHLEGHDSITVSVCRFEEDALKFFLKDPPDAVVLPVLLCNLTDTATLKTVPDLFAMVNKRVKGLKSANARAKWRAAVIGTCADIESAEVRSAAQQLAEQLGVSFHAVSNKERYSGYRIVAALLEEAKTAAAAAPSADDKCLLQ